MLADASTNGHISPEDLLGFVERGLSRGHRRRVEQHLDHCLECVEYLGLLMRSARPSPADETALDASKARTPEEILRSLRPRIIATSPASASRPGRFVWTLVPAGTAAVVVALLLAHHVLIAPARGRTMARQAMGDLITLRQATGRIPLRYIDGFQRASVTRSGFDTVDPAEADIEWRLRRAVDVAPAEVESRLALGLFLLDRGSLDEAERVFDEVLETQPQTALAQNGLAVVLYEKALRDSLRAGDLRERGLSHLREAQRADPDNLLVAFNIAKYHQETGATDEAARCWRTYLRMDPDSEWAALARENLEELERAH